MSAKLFPDSIPRHWGPRPKAVCFLMLFLLAAGVCAASPVTLLAPDRPTVDQKGSLPAHRNAPAADAPEIDILMALTRPYEYTGIDMDMPKSLAEIYFPPRVPEEGPPFERRDLLGDVEEMRYLDKKSWGVNVAFDRPGLYQYLLEAKPWWDEEAGIYRQHSAKVIVPVLGESRGWDLPAGLGFEILPLTRPFGLTAPCIFSGQVWLASGPAAHIVIRMGWINDAKIEMGSVWQENLEAMTDANGNFSFLLTEPGWWYCEALSPGEPLKASTGEMKPSELGTILWIYVDARPRRQK